MECGSVQLRFFSLCLCSPLRRFPKDLRRLIFEYIKRDDFPSTVVQLKQQVAETLACVCPDAVLSSISNALYLKEFCFQISLASLQKRSVPWLHRITCFPFNTLHDTIVDRIELSQKKAHVFVSAQYCVEKLFLFSCDDFVFSCGGGKKVFIVRPSFPYRNSKEEELKMSELRNFYWVGFMFRMFHECGYDVECGGIHNDYQDVDVDTFGCRNTSISTISDNNTQLILQHFIENVSFVVSTDVLSIKVLYYTSQHGNIALQRYNRDNNNNGQPLIPMCKLQLIYHAWKCGHYHHVVNVECDTEPSLQFMFNDPNVMFPQSFVKCVVHTRLRGEGRSTCNWRMQKSNSNISAQEFLLDCEKATVELMMRKRNFHPEELKFLALSGLMFHLCMSKNSWKDLRYMSKKSVLMPGIKMQLLHKRLVDFEGEGHVEDYAPDYEMEFRLAICMDEVSRAIHKGLKKLNATPLLEPMSTFASQIRKALAAFTLKQDGKAVRLKVFQRCRLLLGRVLYVIVGKKPFL